MKGRIVVKIGSNVLSRADGTLDHTRISSLVDQVALLRRRGMEVILVTSGAVACGRSLLKGDPGLDAVRQRQLYSAVGQVRLINIYHNLFREYGITIGQVLTMKENFSTRKEYLNQRNCMEVMLDNGVVPVVNENDTVSVTELMFTDNDELSGLVASMMDAGTLVILSNVDGIYDGAPSDPGSKVIRTVRPDEDLSPFIQAGRSSFGRGGMLTKTSIARKAAQEGIRVIIANGRRDNILTDLFDNPEATVHTEFLPSLQGVSSVKKWIAHSEGFAKGAVRINRDAASALLGDDAASLLPVGVTAVEGDFEEGDIIRILDPDGRQIACGKSAYSSAEAASAMGEHCRKALVHYDYLYIEQ
ncbi:MAG: glutamate 5-kinase [Candidatus Cryptobacteroides sp.]